MSKYPMRYVSLAVHDIDVCTKHDISVHVTCILADVHIRRWGGGAGATGSEAVERATEVLNCVSASFNQKLLDIFNEGPQR